MAGADRHFKSDKDAQRCREGSILKPLKPKALYIYYPSDRIDDYLKSIFSNEPKRLLLNTIRIVKNPRLLEPNELVSSNFLVF